MGRFLIRTEVNGEFIFKLKADTGQTLLTSEMFKEKEDCLKGIESVQKNCVFYSRYEKNVEVNKRHFFYLKDINGKVIGRSELFDSVYTMEASLESVRKNGTSKTIDNE